MGQGEAAGHHPHAPLPGPTRGTLGGRGEDQDSLPTPGLSVCGAAGRAARTGMWEAPPGPLSSSPRHKGLPLPGEGDIQPSRLVRVGVKTPQQTKPGARGVKSPQPSDTRPSQPPTSAQEQEGPGEALRLGDLPSVASASEWLGTRGQGLPNALFTPQGTPEASPWSGSWCGCSMCPPCPA